MALGAVIVQGMLGGLTVLFFLPPPISIGHAGLAQIFFCLTVTLAVVTSPGWKYTRRPGRRPDAAARRAGDDGLVYTQIIVGATMRHNDAGLAIPDFPLAFGHVIPPVWNAGVAIHFAHRIGAIVVTLAILATAGHVLYHHSRRRELARPAFVLLFLVSMQITLGAFVIWSGKDPVINTAHVVNGALVLATSLVLTLRTFRIGVRAPGAADSRRRVARVPAASPDSGGASREVGRGGAAASARAERATSSRWRSRG